MPKSTRITNFDKNSIILGKKSRHFHGLLSNMRFFFENASKIKFYDNIFCSKASKIKRLSWLFWPLLPISEIKFTLLYPHKQKDKPLEDGECWRSKVLTEVCDLTPFFPIFSKKRGHDTVIN